jgi:mannosyl-oligosaccharide alpha-1,2-mannosidase
MTFRPNRRRMLQASSALVASPALAATPERDWHALAGEVRAEMAWAWDNYHRLAWGKDQIKPISGGSESFPLKGHHLGLSLVEGLGTLWVMGLDDQFNAGVDWVKSSLDFDVDGEVSVFETSIRFVGGLLSAHHACGDPVLLARARDLVDRLLPAFDTPTGMPHRFVNLKTGRTRDARTNPAEVGTYLPEWGTLARLTGERRYYDLPKRATQALFARRSKLDLIAEGIDADTGAWTSRRSTVGSGSDSYYEYLWDAWQLFGDADCKSMFDTLTRGILHHQVEVYEGRFWIADSDFETGARISREQGELASFYGGLLAQGGWSREGAAYALSWAGVQDRFGVLPGGYDYGARAATDKANALYPELADAAFNLWLLDRQPRWREIGRTHFLNMRRWNKAAHGYAGLADVTADPKIQSDHCPGYWWAEQMKYYYLLFSDTPRFDYRDNYLSTEGAVLQGFKRS